MRSTREGAAAAELRGPKAKKVRRYPLQSAGPHDAHHGDGHEKLCRVLMPIYGIRDKESGLLLFMQIRPNIRRTLPVALMYLELIEELGGSFTFSPYYECYTSLTRVLCRYAGHNCG
jgi:hypothetical protein